MLRPTLAFLALVIATAAAPSGSRQDAVTVTGTVAIAARSTRPPDLQDVVVWLTPVRDGAPRAEAPSAARPRIVQQNKQFEPHLLVIPVGTSVEFPNRDPFFHNVFSMFDGKRFDLGLYEAGTSRSVVFSRPGVSFIFCNIHPEMSAVIVAVDTPYYAVSDRDGRITIPEVPLGRYRVFAWHERNQPERQGDFPREISISATATSLGVIRFAESNQVIAPHKNKYGEDYKPPPPASPIYKKSGG